MRVDGLSESHGVWLETLVGHVATPADFAGVVGGTHGVPVLRDALFDEVLLIRNIVFFKSQGILIFESPVFPVLPPPPLLDIEFILNEKNSLNSRERKWISRALIDLRSPRYQCNSSSQPILSQFSHVCG